MSSYTQGVSTLYKRANLDLKAYQQRIVDVLSCFVEADPEYYDHILSEILFPNGDSFIKKYNDYECFRFNFRKYHDLYGEDPKVEAFAVLRLTDILFAENELTLIDGFLDDVTNSNRMSGYSEKMQQRQNKIHEYLRLVEVHTAPNISDMDARYSLLNHYLDHFLKATNGVQTMLDLSEEYMQEFDGMDPTKKIEKISSAIVTEAKRRKTGIPSNLVTILNELKYYFNLVGESKKAMKIEREIHSVKDTSQRIKNFRFN
jgi:hypothetical protein